MPRQRGMTDRLQQQAATYSRRLLTDWAVLTWGSDTTRLGPTRIPLVVANWGVLAALVLAAYLAGNNLMLIGIIAAVWLLATIIRAATVMPQRRKTLADTYKAVQKPAGLPAGTANNPPDPSDHLQSVKWAGARRVRALRLSIGGASPAAGAPTLRPALEGLLEQYLPAPKNTAWLFDWPKANTVTCTAVADDDPRLQRQAVERKIVRALRDKNLFNITARTAADGYQLNITGWQDVDRADGTSVPLPAAMDFTCGHQDLTDPGFRDTIERRFDRLVSCPGEWIYTWNIDTQGVTVSHDKRSSLAAQRKRTERKFADDVRAAIAKTGKDPVVADVNDWAGDDSDQPAEIIIDFGTLPLGERQVRDRFEDALDASITSRWPDLRMLFDWQFGGGATRLAIEVVNKDDPRAKQKAVEKKLRNVVEAKFGKARTPVDCDVLEWQDGLSPAGEALPQTAQVNFGSVDVNSVETRDQFQDHWDSLAAHNDWHYEWRAAEGIVTMAAVPKLPTTLAFPEVGSDEFQHAVDSFKAGKLVVGPQRGGGYFYWNLNNEPHGLIGGRTGAGKSSLLDNFVNIVLFCEGEAELIVCDPKMTDFTWTPEMPGVLKFAAGMTEICEAVEYAAQEMGRRQRLLNKRQVKNLKLLRRYYVKHPEHEAEDGPAPKRIVLFFDEIANFWMKSSNEDIEELKAEARTSMEGMGQLARAVEINMIVAAQKPDKDRVSTQLKENLGFRVCVGQVNEYTSKQILDSTKATMFPNDEVPKGRAWAWTSEQGFQVVQVRYLPADTEPCPWDPSITLTGSKQRLREHYAARGYVPTMSTDADGNPVPRWVRVEDDELDSSSASDASGVDVADTGQPVVGGVDDSAADGGGDPDAVALPVAESPDTPVEDTAGTDRGEPGGAATPAVEPELLATDDADRPGDRADDDREPTLRPVPEPDVRHPSLTGVAVDSPTSAGTEPSLWDDDVWK